MSSAAWFAIDDKKSSMGHAPEHWECSALTKMRIEPITFKPDQHSIKAVPSEPNLGPEETRLAPAVYVQNYTVTRDVVLDANVEVVPAGVKQPAGPFRFQVIECPDPSTSVGLIVGIISVVETGPEVVVMGISCSSWSITIFMDDPVAANRLKREVIHHCEV